jgi:hypothetical protein
VRGQFWIFKNAAFKIAEDDFFLIVVNDIDRIHGHLATTARSIDDELGNRISACVATEGFDDFYAF